MAQNNLSRIYAEAYEIAKEHGNLLAITRRRVGRRLGVGASTISYHAQRVEAIQEAVVELAVADRNWVLILQAVVLGIGEVPKDVREEAMRQCSTG